MRNVVKAVSILAVMGLSACGGSSSGGGGSSNPIVKGPQEQDCGDPISLVKSYDWLPNYAVTSRRFEESNIYVWAYPSKLIAQSYRNANPSGEISVTDDDLIEPCSWVYESFGQATPSIWEGEDDVIFPLNGEDVYLTPVIDIDFELPKFQSYSEWKNNDKPTVENAEIKEAKLYIEYAEGSGSRFGRTTYERELLKQTPPLSLICDTAFELKYYEQREESLGNVSPDVCEIQSDTTESWFQCMYVVPVNQTRSCTFTADKVFIPDNKGNFYEAALKGKLYDAGATLTTFRLEIQQVDILN